MSKLREQFESETGKVANNCTGLGDYSGIQADSDIDCEYIEWLENKVESKFTSTSSKSMPCCSCCEHAGYPIDLKVCPDCGREIG